jgi:hypothetical protein
MALPASGPISMSMIATEFGDSSPFSNLSLNTFGVTSASFSAPISASMFYGFSNLTAFNYAGGSGREEPETACEDNGNRSTAYHTGNNAYPVASNVVYSNSSGTTFITANAYKMGSGDVMIVGANGVVSEIFNECE